MARVREGVGGYMSKQENTKRRPQQCSSAFINGVYALVARFVPLTNQSGYLCACFAVVDRTYARAWCCAVYVMHACSPSYCSCENRSRGITLGACRETPLPTEMPTRPKGVGTYVGEAKRGTRGLVLRARIGRRAMNGHLYIFPCLSFAPKQHPNDQSLLICRTCGPPFGVLLEATKRPLPPSSHSLCYHCAPAPHALVTVKLTATTPSHHVAPITRRL